MHNGSEDKALARRSNGGDRGHIMDKASIGGFLVAMAAQSGRGYRRALRYPHDLERQDALQQ